MQKLLKEIEKEIAKASKEFNKAGKIMSRLRNKPYKDMTDEDHLEFSNASGNFQKFDNILTGLYPAKTKIESLINDYSL